MKCEIINGLQIVGMSTTVENNIISQKELIDIQKNKLQKKKIKNSSNIIGVRKNFFTSPNTTTVDLCVDSAIRLIKNLKWNFKDIDVLIFVTQTPDFLMPSCSSIAHNKLELKKDCVSFDINLGCSGYVYGLWNMFKIMENGNYKKGLLLVGDTISKTIKPKDYINKLLFGDAGTSTAIIKKANKKSFFLLGSDGKGCNDLIIDNSGFRKKIFKPEFKMDGKNVFHFAVNNVPLMIKKILKVSSNKIKNISYFVYHQANKFMLDSISRELKIKTNQTLFSISDYGNTSSASIPLTLCKNNNKIKKSNKICVLGFGAGFSYAAAIINLKNAKILKINKKKFKHGR
jgi:3-oxoacyl-[acyl-carrier-protein] synthase III